MRMLCWKLRCLVVGHSYGEASDLGEPAGVVCYACGDRLHACGSPAAIPGHLPRGPVVGAYSKPAALKRVAGGVLELWPVYMFPLGLGLLWLAGFVVTDYDLCNILAVSGLGLMVVSLGTVLHWCAWSR